jgi:ubiquinone biosynthesis monooxygenase Coq7
MIARRLPGDPPAPTRFDRMIRVDHAGEYGAKRIYAGQMAVLKHHTSAPLIEHMAKQEEKHLAFFEKAIAERGVRPTLLHPLWHAAGYALGAATALMGPRAAMACTEAVEDVIDRHYGDQLKQLGDSDPELSAAITEFRGEEAEHRATALEQGAEQATGYPILSAIIKTGCRLAIKAAERI